MAPLETQNRNNPNARKANRQSSATSSVELKGSVFTLTVLRLRSFDVESVGAAIRERIAQAPRFFKNAPIVLDLKDLNSINKTYNFNQLLSTLREKHLLIPVGVRHGSPTQNEAALQAGLAIMQSGDTFTDELDSADTQAPANPNGEQAESMQPRRQSSTATFVDHPIRSGQQVYAKGGDLIITAAVNAGAEVLADGNIHVYAPLRGRALAGIQGDENARIICQCMEAELISIAGNYRVFDEVPEQYLRKPVQVYLQGDKLNINPIGK